MPFARYEVLERELLYASPILLTPYRNPSTVDTEKLDAFVKDSYREAGVRSQDVETGAVITTGEAARKENAQGIVELFAAEAGRFVCATAGPYLEAVLAAHGSGTVERSQEDGSTLLNVDIGGGTTKLALVRNGEITETAVLNVGSRLIAWNQNGAIERIEEAGAIAVQELALKLHIGSVVTPGMKSQLARALASSLAEMIAREKPSRLTERLLITPMLRFAGRIDGLILSGGVSEYVYGFEQREFGDLGLFLGREIRSLIDGSAEGRGAPLMGAKARIRATVIGTCQFTLQLSGDTIYIGKPNMLPIRSLPVIPVRLEENFTPGRVRDAILDQLRRSDVFQEENAFALAFRLPPFRGYGLVEPLAQGICQALDGVRSSSSALVLVFEQNIARVVGERLDELSMGRRFVCIDEIKVGELDYIDVGEQNQGHEFVPVVVKSLVFQAPRMQG
jgi:ethanolamine utilization protein EutA